MSEYVTRCDVAFDGKKCDDLKNFKRFEIVNGIQVPLMSKTGHARVTRRHQFSVDYVVPSGEKFNFKGIWNKPALVAYEDGTNLEYYNACWLKTSEQTTDGEKENVVTVTFGAESASDD